MAQLNVNGTTLEYFDRGEGDPVVFVHGSAGDYRSWADQLEVFSKEYHVYTYSRRYHWPNGEIGEAEEYVMEEHVEDLRAFLREINERGPFHLVGHSYGAFISLLLALREPGLVRSLVLSEPPALTLFTSPQPKPSELLKLLLSRPRTAAAVIRFGVGGVVPATKAFRRGDDQRGIRTFGAAVFGRGGFDRLPEERREQVMDNISNARAELLGPGFAPLDEEKLRGMEKPVLLLNGGRSIPLFHHLADRLAELLPNVRRGVVPEASHLMHEENPEGYNRLVLPFLRNRSGDIPVPPPLPM